MENLTTERIEIQGKDNVEISLRWGGEIISLPRTIHVFALYEGGRTDE